MEGPALYVWTWRKQNKQPCRGTVTCICNIFISFYFCCCSVANLGPALCDPMDCSTPGFPFLHGLGEFAQTHIRGVLRL